jgi:hypothetical protein
MPEKNTRVRPENWTPAHPNEGDSERWKGSPSTETTGDDGSNAKVDENHRRDENAAANTTGREKNGDREPPRGPSRE